MPKHDLAYALGNVEFHERLSAENSDDGLTRGFGQTVGNSRQGWAPGAIFIHIDGSNAFTEDNDLLYVNAGTKTLASWVPVGDPLLSFSSWADGNYFSDDFYGDSFLTYTDTNDGGTGTDGISSTQNWGVREIKTSGDDNDYHYLTTPQLVTDLNNNFGFLYKARIRLAEAATDAANWWCGLIISADIDADIVGANGAGPKADYDGCLFWKVDGTMEIKFEVSKGTSQLGTQTMGDFVSNTWYELGMYWNGTTVTPYLNGTAGTAVSASNAAAAYMSGFGPRAGSGNAETLQVDYHKIWSWVLSGAVRG
jgi:hypothetical protein